MKKTTRNYVLELLLDGECDNNSGGGRGEGCRGFQRMGEVVVMVVVVVSQEDCSITITISRRLSHFRLLTSKSIMLNP